MVDWLLVMSIRYGLVMLSDYGGRGNHYAGRTIGWWSVDKRGVNVIVLTARSEKGEKVLRAFFAKEGIGLTERTSWRAMFREKLLSEKPFSFSIGVRIFMPKSTRDNTEIQAMSTLERGQNGFKDHGLVLGRDYEMVVAQ